MNEIGFNKPFLTGNELKYITQAVERKQLSGNGYFTKKSQVFFESQFAFGKCLLTTSCTDALEMCALLLNIQPGDEVIVPSFTFVSTANAFVLRGAKIVFADSLSSNPNIDADCIETLITSKTKAIVVVHYAGMACDMDTILLVAKKHNLFVVEDAAQAIDSFYRGKPLGSIGHLAAFSFHETKNIISGEGGMLVVNDDQFKKRADILWEKGTNRKAFFNGEVDKYGWVDVGSSFLPSEITAAFLFAQLEHLDVIQNTRKKIWDNYFQKLQNLNLSHKLKLPLIPQYATNNGHMFYVLCEEEKERQALIAHLKMKKINAVFHYLSLHKSPFYECQHDARILPMSDYYSRCLLRLPLYNELTSQDQDRVVDGIDSFFR